MLLAERLAVLQKDVADMRQKLDLHTEGRVRVLEDWRTEAEAKRKKNEDNIKFLFGFSGVLSVIAGLVGHYWK